MSTRLERGREPVGLAPAAWSLLEERVGRALALARGDGRAAFAAVTGPVPSELDASAAVLAARGPSDRFFCLEHPDRDGFALAALGEAGAVEARGERRFGAATRAVRELGGRIVGGDPDPLAAAGPVLVGGFAFAGSGSEAPEWSAFPPVRLQLPELALARRGEEARLTLCVRVEPDDDPDGLLARAAARLGELRPAAMPVLDPHPATRPQVASAMPPAHYEAAVAAAVDRIRAGQLDKVVLAREVRVHAGGAVDPAPVFDALRGAFPACLCYCLGTGDAALVGASPELLARRDGARAQTVALAGTAPRSADPAVDDHLGERLLRSSKEREEQAIVAQRIERTLDPVSLWVAVADEPVIVKVQNVQHLATPIRAQLAQPLAALELAGLLHPTPAVGGEPRDVATGLIPALEGLERGWYAGGVGWQDTADDGEFCVALRCALLRGSVAHLYAGAGVVRDSAPAEELAETEVKLQALLPLLA